MSDATTPDAAAVPAIPKVPRTLPQTLPPLATHTTFPLFSAAILTGAVGNTLIFPGYLGLGTTVWCVAVLMVMAWFHHREKEKTLRSALGIYGLALVAAACLAWRDAPFLRYGSAALFIFCIVWIHWIHGGVRLRKLPIAQFFVHLWGALQAWGLVLWTQCGMARFGAPKVPRELLQPVMRGVIMAAVLLVVFGGLLGKADARFSAFLEGFIARDWATWLSRIFWFVVFTALSIVMLSCRARLNRYWAPGAEAWTKAFQEKTKSLVAVELLIPMAALNVLFAAFVLTQLSYLFGGDLYVQEEVGATYAQYARRGFFELALVAALILPMQLLFDAWLSKASPLSRRWFQVMGAIQSGLLLCILASAAHRMALYLGVYGMTQLRFYASAGILWIGLTILWHMATVLRNHRERFILGALTSAIALFLAVQAINPDGLIARINILRIAGDQTERMLSVAPGSNGLDIYRAKKSSAPFQLDISYLQTLSTDAIPAIKAGQEYMTPNDRAAIHEYLVGFDGFADDARVRTWSWSRWTASKATEGLVGAVSGRVEDPSVLREDYFAASRQASIHPRKVYSGEGIASRGRQASSAGSR